MKSDIYLGENFKLGVDSTVTVELNLSALGIQNSNVTAIYGDFITGIKEVGTSTNVLFPFTIGDLNVLKKVDIVLSESLNTEWTQKDFPLYISISTKEFGDFSHLVQVNLGVEPAVVILAGELEAPGTISLGNLPLEVSNASPNQPFTIVNSGQLSLNISEINFLEFNDSRPDYVSFTDYYGSDLTFPFTIKAGKSRQIFTKFNTQTAHTDDNYSRILKLPLDIHGGFQLIDDLMVLRREPSETDYNEMNLLDEYCKIEIISDDLRSPIYEFPIVQTQFVAPLLFVDKDPIDITNVMEGTNNYREIMIRNASPSEDLIISDISTDYYVTTSDGTSSGTPVDFISFNYEGSKFDFSSNNITIPPEETRIITLNFIDARFPESEISGNSEFTYFKNFHRDITIKSNAVNSFFTGSNTYSDVKSNNSGEIYIPFTISITKKAIDSNPALFINPDFDIILGGGKTPNQAIPSQGEISLEAIAGAFGKTSTDSDWDDYDHLDLNSDNLIDVFDLVQFAFNMDTYESSTASMSKPNADAIYSYIPNDSLGTERSLASDSLPFSILNLTTSNFVDTPLGISDDGDSIEYKLTISTNDYTISPNFHREIPNNLSGTANSLEFNSLVKIDDVPKALGKSSSDSDWATYSHLNFGGGNDIGLYDLVLIGNAIKSADDEGVPTITKVSDAFGKTEETEGSGWVSYSYLDLNNDGVIDTFDLVLVSKLDQAKTSNWIVDESMHTWDSTNEIKIIKDWDDGNNWVYRAYWDTRGTNELKSNPGIHFSHIPLTRDSVMESNLELTITLYARRKNDIHKTEHSISKTIKMFNGQSNIPKPIVKYKMLARKNSKFEYEGRAYHSNLESTSSLTNPTWEVFDVINNSPYAKNIGVSEGMKGLWIENDYDKFSDDIPHFGTYTYEWNFSIKDGVDDQDDYGFTRVSDGKIIWKTNWWGGTHTIHEHDATAFNAQRTSWEPQGLVYKTSGVKTITSKITNTDYNIVSNTHTKEMRIYKAFNEKMEITPIEVSLFPKELRKGVTSVAYITIQNTSLTSYKSISVEAIREFPNKISFGDTLENRLNFDLTPKDYPGGQNSKVIAIYVDVLSDHPRYKKDYSEGQIKIYSESDEDYVIVDLYGDAVNLTWDLFETTIDFSISDDEIIRDKSRYYSLTGYGGSSETTSPHAFVIGFSMSDGQSKGVASDAHNLRDLNVHFNMQDQEDLSLIKTHVLGNINTELSFQDNQTSTKTANGFKVLYVDGETPEINLSLDDEKINKKSLSYQLSHDIIMELSDDKTYRQKNKAVTVNSVDPSVELKLEDSRTWKVIRTHSIKEDSIDPLIEVKLEDDKTNSKIVGYWKNITENGNTPSIDFQIKDDKTSRGTLTHALKKGGSTTMEASLQFSDSKLITIDYGAYKAIKVNNSDPVIDLYWRDNYTKT